MALTLLWLAATGWAAEGTENPDYVVLTPEAVSGLERGKLAAVAGEATAEGSRYSVQDLDVMQPVAVMLVAADPQRPVALEIVKGEWNQIFRSCTTASSDPCEVRFRTQGNFGARVVAVGAAPAAYELGIWVGEEVQEVPSNVVVPRVDKDAGGLGLIPVLLAVIAAALVGLLALALFNVLRHKKATV